MKKILTLSAILVMLSIIGHAQIKNGRISGKVIDGNTKTIESATITLLQAKDSTVAKISVANKDGNFVFDNTLNSTSGASSATLHGIQNSAGAGNSEWYTNNSGTN